MKNIISEYGKFAIYFLITVAFVGVIYVAVDKSESVIPDDPQNNVGNNQVLVSTEKPKLTITSTVIKKDAIFKPLDYVTATDSKNQDISDNIEVFGNVDTSIKGIYDVRYTVRDSIGLFSEIKVVFVVD